MKKGLTEQLNSLNTKHLDFTYTVIIFGFMHHLVIFDDG